MIHSSKFIQPLQKLASAGRARAWLKAFDDPKATPQKRKKAVEALVSALVKGELPPEMQAHAAEGLWKRWDRITPAQQSRLMRVSPARVRAGLTRLLGSESAKARETAASLAARWPRPDTIRAAGALLTDTDPAVAVAAEAALLTAAGHASDLPRETLDALDQTITAQAQRYPEHRRPAILRAVLKLADRPGPHLRRWLAEGPDAEMMPLRAVMKEPGAVSRAQALRLLRIGALASTAAEFLARPAGALDHEHTLSLGPLAAVPSRAEALKRMPDPIAALPEQRELEGLSVEARLGAVVFAGTVPAPVSRRAVALAQMLADPEPVVRTGVVRRLASLAAGSDAARRALTDAVFDPDPSVALTALRGLEEIDRELAARCARRLERSPAPEIRAAARSMVHTDDPWVLLAAGAPAAWPILRHRLADDQLRTLADLRGRVADGDTNSRTLALAAARRLGVAAEIEGEVVAAATGPDHRVASTAVTVLGDLRTTTSRAAVSASLAHEDGRVRSNAVEAIARRNPDEPVVRAWVKNETPRARGNAIRARLLLAGDPGGGDALAEMLRDDRRGHRLSGLWVAERAGMTAVSERVAELARTEAEPNVRQRARRCARRLLAELRLREPVPVDATTRRSRSA